MTSHPTVFLYPRDGLTPTTLGFFLGLGILAAFVVLCLFTGQPTTFEADYVAPQQ